MIYEFAGALKGALHQYLDDCTEATLNMVRALCHFVCVDEWMDG